MDVGLPSNPSPDRNVSGKENVMAGYSPITVARFWSKVDVRPRMEDCWLWTAGTRKGYGFMKIDGRCLTSSRIAWELANGEPLGGRLALHDCDNPLCCNPSHIHAGDHVMNAQEAVERGLLVGRSERGEDNPAAKLAQKEVVEIRRLIEGGETNVGIAKKFDVTHSMISRIRLGKSWAEQTGDEP